MQLYVEGSVLKLYIASGRMHNVKVVSLPRPKAGGDPGT